MAADELGTFSDLLFRMEQDGVSPEKAVTYALTAFQWGVAACMDRLRPTRPVPSDAPSMPAAQLSLIETPALPRPVKPKREPAKGLHRLPADFVLSDDMRAFARERAFGDAAITGMWQKFFNHYRGNGQTAVDWKAKWRTWVLKTVEFNTRDGVSPNGGRADGNFL